MLVVAHSNCARRLGRVGLLAFLALAGAWGGVPAATDPRLEAGFHAMYGLDFASAGSLFQDYERVHPADSLGYAAEATYLVFSELNRLKLLEAEFETDNRRFFPKPAAPPDPQLKQRILDLCDRAQQLAQARLRQNPADEHALFALALTNGMLGDYAARVEHRYWSSVKYGKEGDEFARQLLQHDPQFYDAYVWTGATNYIYGSLSLPLRWTGRLFGLYGDKATGEANLRLAAEKGQYLKPYAKLLLAIAYLRDNNKPAAVALLAQLSAEFPTNGLFRTQAIRLKAGGGG